MEPLSPPPSYSESSRGPHYNENRNHYRIARKPISAKASSSSLRRQYEKPTREIGGRLESAGAGARESDAEDIPPLLPPRPELKLDTSTPEFHDSDLHFGTERTGSGLTRSTVSSTVGPASATTPLSTPSIQSEDTQSSTSSRFQTAYREARYFAGGLIAHPYEHTKHFTILRHSHGLVFYQGTSTTITVSIFADAPLPLERTLWLQSKGWTGKTGMRAKAFIGRNGNWLNVTPSMEIQVEQLKPENERAWQRDITKFRKKADKNVRNHILRETCIVRIPAEAGDGYFQLLLCFGEKEKVLCPSPVFRVLSTSTSPHSIKGASLATLPLEVGAMVLGTYALHTAGTALAPVSSVVQSKVGRYMPSWPVQEAATTAYSLSRASTTVNSTISDANGRYEQVRDGSLATFSGQEIYLEIGPKAPYPFRFMAQWEPGKTESYQEFALPILNLFGKLENVAPKLDGYYFGWVRFIPGKDRSPVDEPWQQAVISSLPRDASQLARASIKEAMRKSLTVQLVSDYGVPPDQSLIEVQLMGFLRPDEPFQRATLQRGLRAGDEAAYEAAILSTVTDVSTTQSILDLPAWSWESFDNPRDPAERPPMLERVKSSYVDTRMAVQRQVDKVPFHKVGVRMPSDQMRDKFVLARGFFVVR